MRNSEEHMAMLCDGIFRIGVEREEIPLVSGVELALVLDWPYAEHKHEWAGALEPVGREHWCAVERWDSGEYYRAQERDAMNRVCRSAFWLAMVVPAIFGQTNTKQALPKDVDGWGKVKWGMPVAQARTLYASEIKEDIKLHDSLIALKLEKVKVGNLDMGALLEVSGERINGVELSIFGLGGEARESAYNTLKAMLIDKYGGATTDNQKSTAIWVFPSTLITLETVGTGILDITYKQSDKKAKDVL